MAKRRRKAKKVDPARPVGRPKIIQDVAVMFQFSIGKKDLEKIRRYAKSKKITTSAFVRSAILNAISTPEDRIAGPTPLS